MADTTTTPCPSHLSQRSQRLWRELSEQYDFETHELELLRLALEALDRAGQARRAIRREGLFQTNRFGDKVAHPAAKVEKDASAAAARLFQQLALPAETVERARVSRG